jgi:hypothetical protein
LYELYVSPEVIAREVLRDLADGELSGNERALARIEALCGRVIAGN